MRRKYQRDSNASDAASSTAALTEANFKMLTKLIHWFAENERVNRNYRMAMTTKLTRIDATISLLLVGQLGLQQGKAEWFREDKLKADSKWAEEFIDVQGKKSGMKMIRYIYGDDTAPEPRRDRRRRWSGWEI